MGTEVDLSMLSFPLTLGLRDIGGVVLSSGVPGALTRVRLVLGLDFCLLGFYLVVTN